MSDIELRSIEEKGGDSEEEDHLGLVLDETCESESVTFNSLLESARSQEPEDSDGSSESEDF